MTAAPTAQPSVLELPSIDRTWWVQVVDPNRPTWLWTDRPERATVFPSRKAADRFRHDECRLFLTYSEKQRLRAADPPDAEAGVAR